MTPIPTHRRGDAQCPTDPALLTRPLDYLANDHFCERQVCEEIERIIGSKTPDHAVIQCVLRFLNEELPNHLRDEAEDLFPHLRRRCPPEDEIEKSITRIRMDQDAASALLSQVRSILSQCLVAVRAPTAPEDRILTRFVMHARRHLFAETAILMPLARARLTARDLQSLSLRMRARRHRT